MDQLVSSPGTGWSPHGSDVGDATPQPRPKRPGPGNLGDSIELSGGELSRNFRELSGIVATIVQDLEFSGVAGHSQIQTELAVPDNSFELHTTRRINTSRRVIWKFWNSVFQITRKFSDNSLELGVETMMTRPAQAMKTFF